MIFSFNLEKYEAALAQAHENTNICEIKYSSHQDTQIDSFKEIDRSLAHLIPALTSSSSQPIDAVRISINDIDEKSLSNIIKLRERLSLSLAQANECTSICEKKYNSHQDTQIDSFKEIDQSAAHLILASTSSSSKHIDLRILIDEKSLPNIINKSKERQLNLSKQNEQSPDKETALVPKDKSKSSPVEEPSLKIFEEFNEQEPEFFSSKFLQQNMHESSFLDETIEQFTPAKFNSLVFKGSASVPFITPDQRNYMLFIDRKRIIEGDRIQTNMLKALGAVEINLENPDGEIIQGLYLSNHDFLIKLNEILSHLTFVDVLGDKKMVNGLTAERELRLYKYESSLEITLLCELGILEKKTRKDLKNAFPDRKFDDEKYLILKRPLQHRAYQPEQKQPACAIVCGGFGVWFTAYTPAAARLLLNGMNVLLFNYRGFGKSEGKPSDKKIYQDLETAVSYVIYKNPDMKNEDLLLFASCGGLSVAAKFAAHFTAVDLVADRSFPSFSRLIFSVIKDDNSESRFNLIKGKVLQYLSPIAYSFENEHLLKKVTGNVLIVDDSKDLFIPKAEREAIKKCMPQTAQKTHLVMTTSVGHVGNWLTNRQNLDEFESFLSISGKSRVEHQLY